MRALIFGRAKGVWDEIAAAKKLANFDVVTAVGSAGIDYPEHFDHWVTWHPIYLLDWEWKRARKGRSIRADFWSGVYEGGQHVFPDLGHRQPKMVKCAGGSSGLLAAAVNLHLYPDLKAVLCGIPMTPDAERYDQIGAWNDAIKFQPKWREWYPLMKDKVRSMSGWTEKLLGTPTKEWLYGTDGGDQSSSTDCSVSRAERPESV